MLPVSGSEGGGPAGPEPGATLKSTQARRKASTGTRTWAEAGTTEGDWRRIEREDHREVRLVCSDPPAPFELEALDCPG